MAAVKLDRYGIKALEAAAIVIEAPKVKHNDLADPVVLGCSKKDLYMGSCWHSILENERYTPAAKQLLSAYQKKARAMINAYPQIP